MPDMEYGTSFPEITNSARFFPAYQIEMVAHI
jgi:hypothetical protein